MESSTRFLFAIMGRFREFALRESGCGLKNAPVKQSQQVIIVGGGLAGLACAVTLRDGGWQPLVLEAGDDFGGRVRTDVMESFLLDRGFQVYLDAYPEAGKLLDLKALDLQPFDPGALVFDGKRLRRVMDPFRRPAHALESARQPIGTLMDKLRVGLLKLRATGWTPEKIASHPEMSTLQWLREFGFSEGIIDTFFRSFYGGIFLERDLRTSSRMFEFTFQMFSRGSATLPARGMQEIPRQLVDRLGSDCLRAQCRVSSLSRHGVALESGEVLTSQHIVLATDATAAKGLFPAAWGRSPEWRSVTHLYFSASDSPLREKLIALNGVAGGLVNNVCVPSEIAPDYAPSGRALISVSVLGDRRSGDLVERVRQELRAWFGDQVAGWRHLRTDCIAQALPEQPPGSDSFAKPGFRQVDGVHICGDHMSHPSIEGAITSGVRTAHALMRA
jgi:phytoene dehydrogenase-like protein